MTRFDHGQARRLRAKGATYAELAARYGVSRQAVWLACDKGRQAASLARWGEARDAARARDRESTTDDNGRTEA